VGVVRAELRNLALGEVEAEWEELPNLALGEVGAEREELPNLALGEVGGEREELLSSSLDLGEKEVLGSRNQRRLT